MPEFTTIPPELDSIIGSESKDFSVKASRAASRTTAIVIVMFGLIWTIVPIGMTLISLIPKMLTGATIKTINGEVPDAVRQGMSDAFTIGGILLTGFLMLIGIFIVIFGIRTWFKEGGYYVGTPSRLIHFEKKYNRSINWEHFTGDIRITGDNQNGDISLQLKSGHTHHLSTNSRRERYVSDFIHIIGIPNVFEIEKICRQRIKENTDNS